MPSYPKSADALDRLAEEIRLSSMVTPDLFADVAAVACRRLPLLRTAGKAGSLDQLIAANAWHDAAFNLIGVELPMWKLRRLVYEDGEWLCSLSRQPNFPATFDETVDGVHEEPALAVLLAFIEARRRGDAAYEGSVPIARSARPASGYVACCDNFV
jgi:hypothetical protein